MVKPSKRGGRSSKPMSLDLTIDAAGVATRAPVEPGQLQRRSNDRLAGIPVFQMKEGEALAEDLGFVVGLDAQALPCVQTSEALLQLDQNILVH